MSAEPCQCPHCDHCKQVRRERDAARRAKMQPKPVTTLDGRSGTEVHLMWCDLGVVPEDFCAACGREFRLADTVIVFPAASDDEMPTVECARHDLDPIWAEMYADATGPFGAPGPAAGTEGP